MFLSTYTTVQWHTQYTMLTYMQYCLLTLCMYCPIYTFVFTCMCVFHWFSQDVELVIDDCMSAEVTEDHISSTVVNTDSCKVNGTLPEDDT